MLPIFDLDNSESCERQEGIQAFDYLKFYDRTSGSATPLPDKNEFVFRVTNTQSLFDWSKSFIHVAFRVDRGTSGNRTLQKATVENDIRSLLRRFVLRFNDVVVEDQTDYLYRRAYIDRSKYSNQYISSVGSQMWAEKDDWRQIAHDNHDFPATFPYQNNVLGKNHNYPAAGNPVNAENLRAPTRFEVTTTPEGIHYSMTHNTDQGYSCYAMIPVASISQFFKVYDKVLRGYDVEIQLTTTNDNIRIIRDPTLTDGTQATNAAAENSTFNWVDSGMTLHLPRVTPTADVQCELSKAFVRGICTKICYNKSMMYRLAIDQGATDGTWSVVSQANRPMMLYAAVFPQESETSQLRALTSPTPNNFSLLNLEVNGQKIPSEDVRVGGGVGSANAFRTKDYQQIYRMFNEAVGNYDNPAGRNYGLIANNIDYWSFQVNPIYVWDLSKAQSNCFSGIQSDCKIQWNLGRPATEPLYLYANILSEAAIQLNMSQQECLASA